MWRRVLILSMALTLSGSSALYAGFVKIFTYPAGGSALYFDDYMYAQQARADFDGDGIADIFAKTGPTEVTIYSIANPDHTPEVLWSYAPAVSADYVEVEGAFDITPDPGKEVAFEWMTYNGEGIYIVGADGTVLFDYPGVYFQDFADFDGDGLTEFVVQNGNNAEIWEYNSSASAVEGMTPPQMSLDQNHPNPFNPTTAINFEISVPNRTRIMVYDLKGKEIWSRDLGMLEPGRHRVVWDGNDATGTPVASGMYFYRVRSGAGVSQKKMMLVK